ncbi:MAG: PTS sugar transporter subunit IIC [Turicibacter sp.]|nr:PTS sugar transporter subunit IIC [Turicibacter sp.]
MKKFAEFLDSKLSQPMAKLASQRHLGAIRDGTVSAIPFILVGSFFLILAAPPLPEGNAIRDWLLQYSAQIILPFRVTTFMMSIYVAFGIGSSLAKTYELDTVSGGQLGLLALLMTSFPFVAEGYGWVLPLANFGGAGLFVTMLGSIFAVEVLRLCKKHNLTIKMPDSVPEGVSRAFAAITPAAIVVVVIGFLTIVLDIDLHGLMIQVISPLVVAGDSLFGVLVFVFLITFFWSFGIHGVAVVGSIARPLWMLYGEANSVAFAAGEALPYVAPETFYQWFVWIGGSGATIGLLIATFIVGRSKYLKTMSRASLVPGLFNINEPVIFGYPIMLNAILIIPFMVAPLMMATVAYLATAAGIVSPTHALVPWTLPGPIGAFLSSGGDWMAVALGLVNIAISTAIYLPFVKVYDKSLLKQEQADEAVA